MKQQINNYRYFFLSLIIKFGNVPLKLIPTGWRLFCLIDDKALFTSFDYEQNNRGVASGTYKKS